MLTHYPINLSVWTSVTASPSISHSSCYTRPVVKFSLHITNGIRVLISFHSGTVISWCLLIFDCQVKHYGRCNVYYYLMLRGCENVGSQRDCLSDYNKRGFDEYCLLVTAWSSGQTHLISVCVGGLCVTNLVVGLCER